jgi:CheY-like chemotaxis protein
LRTAGFLVLTASSPLEALSIVARTSDIDVAVLDYEMPMMNGSALAECLKSKLPKLNTVLYSAAIVIPAADMQKVDTVIRKAEGISTLLRQLLAFSEEVATPGYGSVGGEYESLESRSPPTSHRLPTQIVLAQNAS